MPPEQDGNRDRQLAALRRYVSDLDVRRQDDDARQGRRLQADEQPIRPAVDLRRPLRSQFQ